MRAVAWVNAAAFVMTLVGSTLVAWIPFVRNAGAGRPAAEMPSEAPSAPAGSAPEAHYRRIVSASTIADGLLLALCEPDRIVAFSSRAALDAADGYRFAGKPSIDLADIESVLRLHPDLLFVNSIGDPRRIERLRTAGMAVCDLGEMRGVSTLIPDIRKVAAAIGRPERGERLVRELVDRMSSIAADVPIDRRRRGMYLSIFGGQLFGGAEGTSYHDVLIAAGLIDAADSYRDWPQYTSEQVLRLDPEVLVTNTGMGAELCEHAGLSVLRACSARDGVVEVQDAILSDPGMSIVEAAQLVRDRVYGPPRPLQGSFRR